MTNSASAQVSTPTCTNPHKATADEAASAQNGAIIAGVTEICPGDVRLGISGDVGKAREELAAMRCGNNVNTQQLGPKFAICASRFMKALREKSPGSCIESAFRDPAQQAAACKNICGQLSCPGRCAAPGQSYHQKGLAIDIGRLKMPLQQFWQLATQSGLGNPTGLHSSDPNHIQVMNGGADCADIGYQPTTDDSFVPGPIQSNPYFSYAPSPLPSMPSQAFPGAPVPTYSQPTPTIPSATTPTPSGAPVCTPQFSCSNNVMYYQTTSCLTQVYQTCSNGCSGNSCAVISPTSGTSTLKATTTVSASTTDDLLNSLSNPVTLSATPVGTASSLTLALNGNISNVVGLSGTSTATGLNTGTIASIQPLTSQQTFTSTDLSNSGMSSYNTQQLSGTFKILSDLRAALVWALNYLNPFSSKK